MSDFPDPAFGVSASSSLVQFLGFLFIGMAAGWALSLPARRSAVAAPLAIIGVCGAWFGAEAAHLFGQASSGDASEYTAAMVGAAALAYAWRRFHPPTPERGRGVAIHEPHA